MVNLLGKKKISINIILWISQLSYDKIFCQHTFEILESANMPLEIRERKKKKLVIINNIASTNNNFNKFYWKYSPINHKEVPLGDFGWYSSQPKQIIYF